ncbi:reticulon-3 isoform X1 [Dipodomys merriami]|uniref:reticulon-3 isoform X1 n=1 Tax=Dipodomys merriami TaxID=94247 RepID=UPI00384D6D25
MADSSAATQSPSVSSSSSGAEPSAPGGGSGSSGTCPTLGTKSCGSFCADSFVSSSSSQPVSLFSTSQALHGEKSQVLGSQPVIAKEGKDHLTLLDMKEVGKLQGTSKDGADSLVSLAAGIPCICPSIPTSKEAAPVEEQIKTHLEPRNPSEAPNREDRTALDVGYRPTLLPAQKSPIKPPNAEVTGAYFLSPSDTSGGASTEKDSPESPFEVIIDKAAFDREFKDSYKESTDNLGGWAVHTDGESSADMTETNDKVFPLRSKEAGRYPTSALLTRQFSHTTAALEEVSRCVNDMHNFTNEILTWDLVPQPKQQTSKSSDYTPKGTGLGRSEYHSEIPVINLKTSNHQKVPVCSVSGNTTITKSTGDGAETSVPQDNVLIGKAGRDSPTKEVSVKGVQGDTEKQEDMLSELEKDVSMVSRMATVNVALPDEHLKYDVNWQSSALGEITEADSSGESDDTVIEDITTDLTLENNKIQAEKPVSISSATNMGEKEIKEIPSCETVEKKICANSEEPVNDFEPRQVQSDTLERSPDTSVSEVAPEKPVTIDGDSKVPSAVPPSVFNRTEFSLNTTAFANLKSLQGNVGDTDDSSPEDLMAAFTETTQKGIVDKGEGNVSEAMLEQTTDYKRIFSVETVLRESKANEPEHKDIKSKCSEPSKEINGRELLEAYSSQGPPVASLDLEQEQLTIRALTELGERQTEKSTFVQAEGESPEGRFEQTCTPQQSSGTLEHTDAKTGSDLGISKEPTIIRENRVDTLPNLSKTDLVTKHALARLLTDFSVHDLIFWRDVKKTGFVFGATLIMLLSLAAFSVISVVSYLILALLSVTISFRVYKSVIQAVQKSEEGHPFKAYLDLDITLSSEAFHNYMNAAMVHVNKALKFIIRLFLVEDLVDSLKLAVFMWLMTYVGAVFNGITLLILADLLVFSVPIVYEKYKTQIDHYVGIVRDQTKSIVEKIQAKVPGIAKKKAE